MATLIYEYKFRISYNAKDFIVALGHVWEQEQSLSFNQTEALKRRLESLTQDKKAVVLKQVRGQLADERADIAIAALDEEIQSTQEQLESTATIEQDFVEFIEFAINTVEGFRQKFWELDQEHQVWCKQLLFPDGFSVSRDKKVYTPKISDFYRLATTKEDSEEPSIFNMVSHVDITWNSFLPYLVSLANKLESLGFRYVDGDVIVNKEEK